MSGVNLFGIRGDGSTRLESSDLDQLSNGFQGLAKGEIHISNKVATINPSLISPRPQKYMSFERFSKNAKTRTRIEAP